MTPEDPLGIAAERISFRVSSGVISPALGPALQGCTLDR